MVKLLGSDGKAARGVKIKLREETNLLTNGDFSAKNRKEAISKWKTSGKLSTKEHPAHKSVSLCLSGHLAQAVQRVKVKPGEKYRIEGWVKSSTSKKQASIGVRTLNYKLFYSFKTGYPFIYGINIQFYIFNNRPLFLWKL